MNIVMYMLLYRTIAGDTKEIQIVRSVRRAVLGDTKDEKQLYIYMYITLVLIGNRYTRNIKLMFFYVNCRSASYSCHRNCVSFCGKKNIA